MRLVPRPCFAFLLCILASSACSKKGGGGSDHSSPPAEDGPPADPQVNPDGNGNGGNGGNGEGGNGTSNGGSGQRGGNGGDNGGSGSQGGNGGNENKKKVRSRRATEAEEDVIGRAREWLNVLSSTQVAALKAPETAQALIDRIQKRPRSSQVKLPVTKFEPNRVQICTSNYRAQWTKVKPVLQRIKSSLGCWSPDLLQEVDAAALEIDTILSTSEGTEAERIKTLRAPYLRVQNLLSYCRTKEFLVRNITPAPVVMEKSSADGLLLHIVGDVFGKDSGLEGLSGVSHLEARQRELEQLHDVLAQGFIADRGQANPCHALTDVPPQDEVGVAPFPDSHKEIGVLKNRSDQAITLSAALLKENDYLGFEAEFKKAVDALTVNGESLYFQSGWLMHAIIIEVRRTAPDQFVVRLYNSGEGLSYHLSAVLSSKQVYHPYVEKAGVSSGTLLSKGFVKTIYDLRQVQSSNNQADATNYYQLIGQTLDGAMLTRKPAFEDLLEPQISGTCAYYSVPYYLRASGTDPTLGDFVETHVKFGYTDRYFHENKDRLEQFILPYNLAKKALVFFAESVGTASRKDLKHIDAGFEQIVVEKTTEYQNWLALAFNQLLSTLERANAAVTATLANLKPAVYKTPDFRLPDRVFVGSTLTRVKITSRETWVPETGTFQSDLAGTQLEISKEIGSASSGPAMHEAILQVLQAVAQKLPLAADFIEPLSAAELTSILGTVRQLSEYYLWTILADISRSTRERGLTPQEYLVQLKYFSFASLVHNRLKVLTPKAPIAKIPPSHLPSMDSFLRGEHVLFNLHDAAWHDEFNKMVEFWRQVPARDFFGFDGGNLSCRDLFESEGDEKIGLQLLPCPVVDTQTNGFLKLTDLRWLQEMVPTFGPEARTAVMLQNIRQLETTLYKWHYDSGDEYSRFTSGIYFPYVMNHQPRLRALQQDEIRARTDFSSFRRLENTGMYKSEYLGWNAGTPFVLALALLRESPISTAALGREFYDLRTLTFATAFFAKGSFSRESADALSGRWRFDSAVSLAVKSIVQSQFDDTDPAVARYFRDVDAARQVVPGYQEKCHRHQSAGWRCEPEIFGVKIQSLKRAQPLDTWLQSNERLLTSLVPPVGELLRLRQSTNALVIQNFNSNVSKQTFDTLRQVATIAQDRDSQIVQSFGFFQENQHLFMQDEWRDLVKKLHFDPGVLAQEAERNPLLSKDLGSFCRTYYEQYKKEKDFVHASYFLRLSQYYAEHMGRFHLLNPSRVRFAETDFVDARSELKAAIERNRHDETISVLLYRDLIRTYLTDTTFASDQELSWFLSAHIYRNIHSERTIYEIDGENDIRGFLIRKKDVIEAHLKKDASALNDVVRHFHGGFDPEGHSWRGDFPLYHYDNPTSGFSASVDVATGVLFISARAQKSLPAEVVHDTYFQSIIGTTTFASQPLDLGSFTEFVIKRGDELIRYRVAPNSGKMLIRRKWGDRWYEHMRSEQILELTLKTETESRTSTEMGLFPGYSHWIAVNETSDTLGYVDKVSTPAYFGQRDKQVDSSSFEILVFAETQSRLAIVTFLNKATWGWGNPLQVDRVVKVDHDHWTLTDYVLHPVDKASPYFELLRRFEHPRYIFVWKRKVGGDPELDLPRLNLQFTYDEAKKVFVSREYGTLLNEGLPHLMHTGNHLLFSGKSGRTVIFSQFEVVNDTSEQLDSKKLHLEFEINEFGPGKRHFFVYSQSSETKDLRAFDNSSKLYLAYLYLLNQTPESYERGLRLVQELKSQVAALSPQDLRTLGWILSKKLRITDPFAVALRLKILATAAENANSFHSSVFFQRLAEDRAQVFPSDRLFISVAALYVDFLRQRPRLDTRWLLESEEVWLFHKNLFALKGHPIADLRREELVEGKYVPQEGISEYDWISYRPSESTSAGSTILSNFREIAAAARAGCAATAESILQGGSLLRHFPDFYGIALAYHTLSASVLEARINNLFTCMKLGTGGSPRDDFKSYLMAIAISRNQERFSEISLAKVLLTMIEPVPAGGPPKKFWPWHEIVDWFAKRDAIPSHEWNRISDFDQTWWAHWDSYPAVLKGTAPATPTRLNLPAVLTVAKADQPFQAEANSNDPKGIDFRSIATDPVLARYLLDDGNSILSPADIDSLVREVAQTQDEVSAFADEVEDLKDIFAVAAPTAGAKDLHSKIDAGFLRASADLRTKLDENRDAISEIPRLEVVALARFRGVADKLRRFAMGTVQPLKNSIAQDLLKLVNKRPASILGRVRRTLESFAKLRADADIQTIARLYATQDGKGLLALNEVLDLNDANSILKLLKSYLIVATYASKLEEVRKLAERVDAEYSKWRLKPMVLQNELRNFVTAAIQERAYAIDEHPDYLVFEYYMGFLIRDEQVKALEALNIKDAMLKDPAAKGALYELIMGSGKTSVLLPLISYLNMDNDSLSVVVFPERLLPSMSQQLNEQMLQVFGRHVEVIDISRRYFTPKINANGPNIEPKDIAEAVQSVYDRLVGALRDRRLVVMSNSTVQSLFLLFVESMRDETRADQIRIFRNIFAFLRKHAYLTIDEVDSVLDIMKAHRFSIGKPVAFNKDAFFPSVGIYNLLLSDPATKAKISLPFIDANNAGHKTVFNSDYYHTVIKNILITKLATKESAEALFFHDLTPELAKLYSELDFIRLEKYFRSENSSFNRVFLDGIKDEVLRGFVATLYTQLHLTLPLTFEKLHKVHYGLFPREACTKTWCPEFIAIPYQSGTPLPDSRFGSDLESLNYAIQAHLEEKQSLNALVFVVKKLQDDYNKASKRQKTIIMKRARTFLSNMTETRFLTLRPEDLRPYADAINEDQSLLLNLLVQPLRANIEVFNHQTSTNALIYPSLFKRIQGVTGTLWNQQTMAPFYDPKKVSLSDTAEKTLTLLWTNSKHKVDVLELQGGDTLDEKVEILLRNRDPGSVIDQGGLFRGHDNGIVAKKILQYIASAGPRLYENIIYYDRDDNIKILSTDGSIKDYHPALVDRSKTVAFWDLQHTTGSDLKVDESSKAVMVINKNTIQRDLMQAAWRMRGLHLGQSVDFAIQQMDAEYIRNYVVRYFNRKMNAPTLADILFFTFARERDMLNDQVFRSVSLGMQNALIQPVVAYLLKSHLTDNGYKALYGLTRSLFEVEYPDYSYTIYGYPVVQTPTPEALAASRGGVLESKIFKYMKDNVIDESSLQTLLQGLEDRGIQFLPATVRTQRRSFEEQIEVETELEMEIEIETSVEQEIEQKIETYAVEANLLERDEWLWKEGDFFKGNVAAQALPATVLKSEKIHEATTARAPVAQLRVALQLKGQGEFAGFLNPKIFVSMNASPAYSPAVEAIRKPFKFFSIYQKELNDLLFVVDQHGKIESATLISREETVRLGYFLEKDLNGTVSAFPHAQGMLLYNLGGSFYRYNKNVERFIADDPDFLRSLAGSREFVDLVTQVKYFTGRSNLSTEELKALDRWFDAFRDKQEVLLTTFENQVLKFRQRGRIDFAGSPMAELLSQRKKMLGNSKHHDETWDFEFGPEDQRKDAKENLIRKIESDDQAAWTESQTLVDRVLAGGADLEVQSDAIDLTLRLLGKGQGVEKATFAVIRLAQENHKDLKAKVHQLGSAVFGNADGREAVFSFISRELHVENTKYADLEKSLSPLLKAFAAFLFSDDTFTEKFMHGFMSEALDQGVGVASMLGAMLSQRKNTLPVLVTYLGTLAASADPVQQKRGLLLVNFALGEGVSVDELSAVLDGLVGVASSFARAPEAAAYKLGLRTLATLVEHTHEKALREAVQLLTDLKGQKAYGELSRLLETSLAKHVGGVDPSVAATPSFVAVGLGGRFEMIMAEKKWDLGIELVQGHFRDSRSEVRSAAIALGKQLLAEPEARVAYETKIAKLSQTESDLAVVLEILKEFKDVLFADAVFVGKIVSGYFGQYLDRLGLQVVSSGPLQERLRELFLVIAQDAAGRSILDARLAEWENDAATVGRAQALHLLFVRDAQVLAFDTSTSVVFVDQTVRDPELAIGSMTILELLLAKDEEDGVNLAVEAVVSYRNHPVAEIRNASDILAARLRANANWAQQLDAALVASSP